MQIYLRINVNDKILKVEEYFRFPCLGANKYSDQLCIVIYH